LSTRLYGVAMYVRSSLIRSVKAKTHFVCSRVVVSTLNLSHLRE
jgi:hypothetical protein